MTFPINVYLAATVSACATVLATLPLWRKWCLRTGLVDEPGHRKIHDQPIPLAGGLAVITGLVVPVLAACLLLWWQGVGHPAGGVFSGLRPPSRESGGFVLLDPRSVFLLQYGLGRVVLEVYALGLHRVEH